MSKATRFVERKPICLTCRKPMPFGRIGSCQACAENPNANDELKQVVQYMPMVNKLARKMWFTKTGKLHGDFEDLMQIGAIGLIEAHRRFDASKGFKFITYAMHWVWGRLRTEVNRKAGLVRLPANLLDEFFRESKVGNVEISEASKLISRAMNVGFFAEYDDGKRMESELPGRIANEFEPLFSLTEIAMLGDAIKKLPFRDQFIVKHRFGLGGWQEKSLGELGQELGISKERVRQIESRAIEEIKYHLLGKQNASKWAGDRTATAGRKICIGCNCSLPLSAFGVGVRTKGGPKEIRTRCKECMTIYWRKKTAEKKEQASTP